MSTEELVKALLQVSQRSMYNQSKNFLYFIITIKAPSRVVEHNKVVNFDSVECHC